MLHLDGDPVLGCADGAAHCFAFRSRSRAFLCGSLPQRAEKRACAAVNVRNLSILFVCQLISVSGSIVLVTLGGILGSKLAPDPALATLPLSIMVVGTALATIFAALLMRRIGRRSGFTFGASLACGAGLLAAHALSTQSFGWLCAGTGLYGVSVAFVQQYRFAAAESVAAEWVSRAVSTVLLGSIGGAVLGPFIATAGRDWVATQPYLGAMFAIAVLHIGAILLLPLFRNTALPHVNAPLQAPRPLFEVVAQPLYVVAVLGGIVAGGVMTLIMTATPLSMHVGDGFSLEDTGWVIRSHVIAMYAPSLISGVLIARFGARRIMVAGVGAMAVCVLFGLQGHELMHYWLALVLLGIGWNFLYVGGTSLLVTTYRPAERFSAQAVNEFSAFGVSALGSLLAGTIIHRFDWDVLMWSAVPLLALMLVALVWARGVKPNLD
jgi:MFS family permease